MGRLAGSIEKQAGGSMTIYFAFYVFYAFMAGMMAEWAHTRMEQLNYRKNLVTIALFVGALWPLFIFRSR